VLEDAAQAVGLALTPGLSLVLIGEIAGHLGQSLWLREIAGLEAGPPPPVDLVAERAHGDFVRAQILAGAVQACHDISDGGLLVAIAEMAMGGAVGATLLAAPAGIAPHAYWFGEDQACYVLAADDPNKLLAAATAAKIPARLIGKSGGGDLTLPEGATISIKALSIEHARFFAEWMEAPAA
jgi:phosphoribosylformylglycinamidine synthase